MPYSFRIVSGDCRHFNRHRWPMRSFSFSLQRWSMFSFHLSGLRFFNKPSPKCTATNGRHLIPHLFTKLYFSRNQARIMFNLASHLHDHYWWVEITEPLSVSRISMVFPNSSLKWQNQLHTGRNVKDNMTCKSVAGYSAVKPIIPTYQCIDSVIMMYKLSCLQLSP